MTEPTIPTTDPALPPTPEPQVAAEAAPAPEPPESVPCIEATTAPGPAVVPEAPVDRASLDAAVTPAAPGARRISRRTVLKAGAAAVPCLAGSALVFSWLSALADDGAAAANGEPIVSAYDPAAHRWGFVVDTNRCIGCGLCVVACKDENDVPEDPEYNRTWVERHTTTADGVVHVDSPEGGINGYRAAGAQMAVSGAVVQDVRFVPRLCMQCEESPCTAVCPVGATYRTPDGIVLVDEERCIGCGYCVVACPYGARYIVPAGPRTPRGVAGVADKCTFCYHRITKGKQPACVDACPVGARIFGDLDDPASPVSIALRRDPTTVMKPELGTKPRVHYVGLEAEAVG